MRDIAIPMTSQDLLRFKQRPNDLPVAQLPSLRSFEGMKSDKKRSCLAIGPDVVNLASPMLLDIDNLKLQVQLRRAFNASF